MDYERRSSKHGTATGMGHGATCKEGDEGGERLTSSSELRAADD